LATFQPDPAHDDNRIAFLGVGSRVTVPQPIRKIAAMLGVGTGTVQRIKAEMSA
jgi:hypothetical protein